MTVVEQAAGQLLVGTPRVSTPRTTFTSPGSERGTAVTHIRTESSPRWGSEGLMRMITPQVSGSELTARWRDW
ncbi:hypothetical protein [Micromonospora inyonensis]|uniref:hypothetical protein n=1 Tax=Micromonospora inyonensis TaxID=47866 RepID=UPI000B833743|nr:hypothetical protein [Micromonospora inyonensis]